MATSISGIHGHLLEVTVIGCTKLKDTEWISRQDPYVCLEYASSKFRTRTCTDGGKNPTFQEKFVFTLIEGLRELNVLVWNSNTIRYDDFIGGGKIQLEKVLSQGYDDSSWTIHTKSNRFAGEVRLIMHYANANSQKPPKNFVPSASPVSGPSAYAYPPPSSNSPYLPPSTFPYPPQSSAPSYPPTSSASLYPSSASLYPPPSSAAPYPPSALSSLNPPPSSPYSNQSYYPYQHDSTSYSGSTYPPPHSSAYPQPYPPPPVYPPVPYPPPAQSSHHYPPGPSYPGTYPPPY